jgi:hypothetical protein
MVHYPGHVEPQTYKGIQKKKDAEVLDNEFAANQVRRGELDAMMLRAAAESIAGNQSRQSFDRSSQVRGPLPNMADLIPPIAKSSGGRATTAGLEALANANRTQPSTIAKSSGGRGTQAGLEALANANLTATDAIKSILNPVNDQGVSPYFPNSTINPANDPGVSSYFPNKNIYQSIDNYGMDPYFPNKDLTDEQLKAAYGDIPFGGSSSSEVTTPGNEDPPNVTQCPPGSVMNADGQCELIESPEEEGCPDGYSKNAAGVCVIDAVVVVEPPAVAVDLFGDQATLINQQLGGLSTKNFTDDIKALMAEAEKGAKAVTAQQIKDIAASYGVATKNIDEVAKAATTALNAQEVKRKAVQAEVGTIASNQITAMLSRQEADVAAGQALLGENLTSEFTEVVQLTNALINSQAVSAQSSMGRIQAIGNMAAAQRLAAPALMMADAKNALGDEKFSLEGQAQAALVKTLNSLSVQEKELVLAEAQRIESFNNNRDAALAQALVNNGMAKLQNTIEEQRLAVSAAARASELRTAAQADADAAVESKRRFELEFGLKEKESQSVIGARNAAARASLAKAESDATAVESKAAADYNEASVIAAVVYGPGFSVGQIEAIQALSSTQRNALWTRGLDEMDAFFDQETPGTFDSLVADGFSSDIAQFALLEVKKTRRIMQLEKKPEGFGEEISQLSQEIEDIRERFAEGNGLYSSKDDENQFAAAVDRIKATTDFSEYNMQPIFPPAPGQPNSVGIIDLNRSGTITPLYSPNSKKFLLTPN